MKLRHQFSSISSAAQAVKDVLSSDVAVEIVVRDDRGGSGNVIVEVEAISFNAVSLTLRPDRWVVVLPVGEVD
jgi:hypothetical protein